MRWRWVRGTIIHQCMNRYEDFVNNEHRVPGYNTSSIHSAALVSILSLSNIEEFGKLLFHTKFYRKLSSFPTPRRAFLFFKGRGPLFPRPLASAATIALSTYIFGYDGHSGDS